MMEPQVVEHDFPLDVNHGTEDRPWLYHRPSNTVHLGPLNAYHQDLWDNIRDTATTSPHDMWRNDDWANEYDSGRLHNQFMSENWLGVRDPSDQGAKNVRRHWVQRALRPYWKQPRTNPEFDNLLSEVSDDDIWKESSNEDRDPEIIYHRFENPFGSHGTDDRPWLYHVPSNTIHLGPVNTYHWDLWNDMSKDQSLGDDYFSGSEYVQGRLSEKFLEHNFNKDDHQAWRQYHPFIQDALRRHVNWQGQVAPEVSSEDIWEDHTSAVTPQVMEHDFEIERNHGSYDRPWIYHGPSNTIHLGPVNGFHHELWPQVYQSLGMNETDFRDRNDYEHHFPAQGRTNRPFMEGTSEWNPHWPVVRQTLTRHLNWVPKAPVDNSDLWEWTQEHTAALHNINDPMTGTTYHVPVDEYNQIWYDALNKPAHEAEQDAYWALNALGLPPYLIDKEINEFFEEHKLKRPSRQQAPEEKGLKFHSPDARYYNLPYYNWRIPVSYFPDTSEVRFGPPGSTHGDLSPRPSRQYHGLIGLQDHPDRQKHGYTPGFTWLEESPGHEITKQVMQGMSQHYPEAAQVFKRPPSPDEDIWEDDMWQDDGEPVDTRFPANGRGPFTLGHVWLKEEPHESVFKRIWNKRNA